MKNIIIITNSEDIPAALSVASTLEKYETYTFDPALLDKLATAKFKNIRFIECPHHPTASELTEWSKKAAFDLESELDHELRELLPGISLKSWQSLCLCNLFIMIRWYSNLWQTVSSHLAGGKIHVLVCDKPAYHFTTSFIPSILLLQYLLHFGIEVSAYTYPGNAIAIDVMPELFSNGECANFDIVTHLPTCFYDNTYFNSELEASGKSILNISSNIWSVQTYAAKTIDIVSFEEIKVKLTGAQLSALTIFFDTISVKLNILLEQYITSPLYRSRQAHHFATIYKCQLATYLLLNDYFATRKPSKIVLSNHDAGFHGPLLSFSEKHGIPIIMVPHSKTGHDLDFNAKNITHLAHPLQGEYSLDRSGKRVLNFYLAYPEKFEFSTIFPAPIKKIGLLLNAIGTYGIMGTHYNIYLDGIKKIHQWCIRNSIELAIRCRPGETIANSLIDAIGIEMGEIEKYLSISMTDFAKGVDVCLMYDIPTSGQMEFLNRSIPILNPVPAELPWFLAKYSNKNIVPRGSVNTILDTLNTFISDETSLFLFRNSQFADYVVLFKNALPLRMFL